MSAVSTARPASPPSSFSSRTLTALLALYLVWSSTYYAMRVAVAALPPLGMAGVRYIVAGVVLLAVVGRPSRREWLLSVPIGALLFLGGNGLVVVAQRNGLASGLAAVVCATTPLIAALIGAAGGDRPRRAEMIGIALGVSGVLVLASKSPLAGGGAGVLLVLGAPVAWAIGSLLARRAGAVGLTSAAAQMIVGGVWLTLASLVMGEHLPAAVPLRSALAWVYLVVFGSLVGFTAYIHLLRTTRPSVAMSYAYVNPVIAVLLGAALGGERVGWATLAATVLIAAGVSFTVVKRS
jgi:drug/metabolite transporter (DMT)-like permease